MDISQVFLGIIIVGIIMTVKVVVDGMQEVAALTDSINALRLSIQQCERQIEEEQEKTRVLEQDMEQVKATVLEMEQKEKEINNQIRALRAGLEGQKSKLDT